MIEKIPYEWRYRDSETGMFYPWYTKPCLEWLVTLNLKRRRIFEYGCGDSTKWYRSHGAIVHGVESNLTWADIAKVKHEAYYPAYVESICPYVMRDGFFDIVVIDGIWRDDCTEFALTGLKPGGYLIIDNWMQPSVEPNDWSQTQKLIEGMPIMIYKETEHYDWQTAVITKP